MIIKVIALAAQNCAEEISVTIELTDGVHTEVQKHTLLTSQYAALGIKKGELDKDKYDEIVTATSICSAYKKGLSLLSYTASSEKNLYYKLKSRGFEDDVCQEAIKMLAQGKYLDDNSSCIREAEKCALKLWGKKRIASHLYSKGYASHDVSAAINELDVDYIENCTRLILKNYKRQLNAISDDENTKKKLVASLVRMGYSFGEIKAALSNLLL